MKVLDFTGLKNVQKVTKGLSQLLADLQVYYTNLRGFHWNIKGKNFYVLHKQFEDMYNDAAEKVDEVAERLLMFGLSESIANKRKRFGNRWRPSNEEYIGNIQIPYPPRTSNIGRCCRNRR